MLIVLNWTSSTLFFFLHCLPSTSISRSMDISIYSHFFLVYLACWLYCQKTSPANDSWKQSVIFSSLIEVTDCDLPVPAAISHLFLHLLLLWENQTLQHFQISFPRCMQFIIQTQYDTKCSLMKRRINYFHPLSVCFFLFFFLTSRLQWKNMNYSTAWWTCAELQRIWRLASDRKWGIFRQNTLFRRWVRLMSHYFSRCWFLSQVIIRAVVKECSSPRSGRQQCVYTVLRWAGGQLGTV